EYYCETWDKTLDGPLF
nr:immunoglobulin light chain junction region [Macaca mulatta]